jgi:hypothetical protein
VYDVNEKPREPMRASKDEKVWYRRQGIYTKRGLKKSMLSTTRKTQPYFLSVWKSSRSPCVFSFTLPSSTSSLLSISEKVPYTSVSSTSPSPGGGSKRLTRYQRTKEMVKPLRSQRVEKIESELPIQDFGSEWTTNRGPKQDTKYGPSRWGR